jgi:UDP-2,3-diacylglucosamine pyrophosphatase LpxH
VSAQKRGPAADAVAIVADAHLNGPGGSVTELVTQLRALAEKPPARLVLLGDIFHVWVGYAHFEPPGLAELLVVLQAIRARGTVVDYLEGNRDFYLAGSPYEAFFDSIADEVAFTAGGVR